MRKEVRRQQRNISFTQRRQRYTDHVEPVVESSRNLPSFTSWASSAPLTWPNKVDSSSSGGSDPLLTEHEHAVGARRVGVNSLGHQFTLPVPVRKCISS